MDVYHKLKCVVVVILGRCSLIKLLIQDKQLTLNDLNSYSIKQKVAKPFAMSTVDFISDFSKELMCKEYREYPDLQALAYWFRKSKIKNFKEKYSTNYTPLGTVFHICPSNVDTIFVYSLFISLLMGNMNIVRISSKDSIQINILLSIFKKMFLVEKYENVLSRILLLSYERDDQITTYFSSHSHLRVFWGGDEAINNLRRILAPSYTEDIYFPDRESICVVDQSRFNNLDLVNKQSIFKSFLNDVKTFNQQACSSPLRLFWIGDKRSFQSFLDINENSDFDLGLDNSELMDKFVSVSSMAVEFDNLNLLSHDFSKIIFVNVQAPGEHLLFHARNGLILVTFISELSDIIPYTSPKTQTLSQYGLDNVAVNTLISQLHESQIDRICKIGSSLDFDHIWDGKDLFVYFSRTIRVDL